MAMPDPATVAQKWVDRMNGASTAYTQGVQRTDVNPMQAAAANSAGYLAGVQAAVSSGKWQAGLNRTTKEQWVNLCTTLGAQRLGPGATAAKPKFQAFMSSFLPVLSQNVAQVKQMPNATFEQRIARMNQMAQLNHQYKRGG